ncbi:MAG: hypothetical protein VYE77_09580 [Planctomycetota bacterium]|nr:hypothetical protein [Planctomycetota bacterium]
MRQGRLWVGLSLLATLTSCTQFDVAVAGGYTQLSVSGDVGLDSSGSPVIDQSIESIGLGEDQGSAYARLEVDMGVPQLAISGFRFEEQGRGTLGANFGNVPATADVVTDLRLDNIKLSYTFELELGPISLAPGLAVDWFDIDLRVADEVGIASEEVQVTGPVPLLFLQGEADLGYVGLVGEVGYLAVPEIEDVEASLLDVDVRVEVYPTDWVDLFVGYRSIMIEGNGTSDDEDYDLDLELSGFFVGGGFRF